MSESVPPFHGNISFNAQHAPMGAFMSFTCGMFGLRGGIGVQMGQPADQEIYIGIKDGDRHSDALPKCLPFFRRRADRASDAFLIEQAGPSEQNPVPDLEVYSAEQIQRRYGWATDAWQTDDFTFEIFTPFGPIHEPAVATHRQMRECLLPGVAACLTVDNRHGKNVKTGFFALNFTARGTRVIEEGLGGGGSGCKRVGFALRTEMGVAGELVDVTAGDDPSTDAEPDKPAFEFMRWSVSDGLRDRHNPVHLLGSCPGIGFEVPPGKRYALILAIGCYLPGVVTTRLEGRYFYSRYYIGLNDVLSATLDRAHELATAAEARDRELSASGLSADQQFMIAHATRSYYGSTQMLEVGGNPFWVVNEGEYCMMNTLDLSVDHVFWELEQNSWVVRNLLDRFVRYYSYHDHVKIYADDPAGSPVGGSSDPDRDPSAPPPPPNAVQLARKYELGPGGISFCHDMGAHNNFSPEGRSSYELANITGCFSYMTQEQLCNWILTAACYVARTDGVDWLRQNIPIVSACLDSMIVRGGEAGFAHYDSSQCLGGSEITTYDSLDESLAQARNNVYIAVKSWACYLGLAMMFERTDNPRQAEALKLADRVADVVMRHVGPDGALPAVFEINNPGYKSRILPAVEGLLYPHYWMSCADQPDKSLAGRMEGPFIETLRKHTLKLLDDGSNVFADGGIKLSSTSNNSWMSKIAIFMYIAREILGLRDEARIQELFRKADAAHVKWQTDGSSYWACSDQILSGVAKGSRYYPRVITTALWMSETKARGRSKPSEALQPA